MQECTLGAGLAADYIIIWLVQVFQLEARFRLVRFRRLLSEAQRLKKGVLYGDAHILVGHDSGDLASLHIYARVRSVE